MLKPRAVIISLRTAEFDRALEFYTKLLGPPHDLLPEKHARFQLPGCSLVVWRQTNYNPVDGGTQLCFSVADLEQVCAEISQSWPISDIKEAAHGREAFLQDPDGNTLIVYEPRLQQE